MGEGLPVHFKQARIIALEEAVIAIQYASRLWRGVPAVHDQMRLLADRLAHRAALLRADRFHEPGSTKD